MAAPDLPTPIVHTQVERPISAWPTPAFLPDGAINGSVVVVIDAIRASTTITAALYNGAAAIIPVLTVADARRAAQSEFAGASTLIGGERGGRLIEGFSLGNSPSHYTPGRVTGRTIIFTTTNGTAALLAAARGRPVHILVGAMTNVTAVCTAASKTGLPVHLLCAGTRDQVSADDCLAAGLFVQRFADLGYGVSTGGGGDEATLCHSWWRVASSDVRGAMLLTRGGRNLQAAGLESDLEDCVQIDSHGVVPRFEPNTGRICAVDSRTGL